MKPPPAIPLAKDSTAPDSVRLGVVLPRLVRRPDVAGWWYDAQEEQWRWIFQDPGYGLCARSSKHEGHYWPVSNYKSRADRWYGPWSLPNEIEHPTGGV